MVVLVERVVRRRHAERFVDTHVPSLLVVLAVAAVAAAVVAVAVAAPPDADSDSAADHLGLADPTAATHHPGAHRMSS